MRYMLLMYANELDAPQTAPQAAPASADSDLRALHLCRNNVERAYLQRRLDEMLKDGS